MDEVPDIQQFDTEAEMSVLGCMLKDNSCIDQIEEILTVGSFYSTAHTLIFQAITSIHDKGKPVDLVILANELKNSSQMEKVGGAEYLGTIFMSVASAANALEYARIVREKETVRKLRTAAQGIMSDTQGAVDVSGVLEKAENTILDISKVRVQEKTYAADKLLSAMNLITERYVNGRNIGIDSGFFDLDEYIGGFKGGQFVVIAARPSQGKSSLAMKILEQASIVQGKPCVLFSFEMAAEEITRNMLCSMAMVDSKKLEKGNLSELEYRKLLLASMDFANAPLIVDDSSSLSMVEIKARARRLKKEIGLQMIVIDYLQLMGFDEFMKDDRQLEVERISRALKNLSRELQIPVIACSQLNREVEKRDTHKPQMSDLRSSGAIEMDADILIFLHAEETFNEVSALKGVTNLIIAKQRNGPTGTVRLVFEKQFTRFDNLLPVAINSSGIEPKKKLDIV